MSLADQELSYPKLPVWHTVRLSYSTYLRHFNDALRASWLWLIVVAALAAVAGWLEWSWMAMAIADHVYPKMSKPAELIALSGLNTVLALLAGVSIAVAWHRLLILHERPGLSGSNIATKNLWRYVLIGLALYLIVLWPVIVISPAFSAVPAAGHGAPSPTFIVAIVLAGLFEVAGGVIALRFLMLLPARAVGNVGLTFKQAWKRTRGNTWRVFWGLWFTMVPPLLIGEIAFVTLCGWPVSDVNFGEGTVARMTIFGTAISVYALLIAPIMVGFLSHAYRHFFQAPIERAA